MSLKLTLKKKREQPVLDSPGTVQEIITGQLNKNLVVFAGPREVGKTVALIRLTHFLRKNRSTKIEPNRTYRTDQAYQTAVNEFLDDLNKPEFSPSRTGRINFLVLDVFKHSQLYCQFLEAPGEAFFNPKNPHDTSFPPYIASILNNHNLNKVYVLFFEYGMLLDSDPRAYSSRLTRLASMMNRREDDVIILFNKADRQRNLYSRNRPNVREFKNQLYNNEYYVDFFGELRNLGIPVKFVPFSSGDFQKIPGSKTERWIHSDDFYPETLWRNIDKCFKSGVWW